MPLAFTLIDLDGLDGVFDGAMSALGLLAIVLALMIGVGVMQMVIDRVRSRVRVQR